MSEPIRYDFIYNENYASVEREEHKEGDYVSYEDYARLKAEVERLNKAANWVLLQWDANHDGGETSRVGLNSIKELRLAAKEGKQP